MKYLWSCQNLIFSLFSTWSRAWDPDLIFMSKMYIEYLYIIIFIWYLLPRTWGRYSILCVVQNFCRVTVPSPAPKDFKMQSSQSIAWSTVKLMTSLDGPAVVLIGAIIFTSAVMGWKQWMVHSGVSWYIMLGLVSWGHLIPIRWGFSETVRWSSENYLLMTAEYVFFMTHLRRYTPPLCYWQPIWSLMCSPAYPIPSEERSRYAGEGWYAFIPAPEQPEECSHVSILFAHL